MKKIISILLLATFCIFTQLHAQNRADELMKQAQENLTKKEYIKARMGHRTKRFFQWSGKMGERF